MDNELRGSSEPRKQNQTEEQIAMLDKQLEEVVACVSQLRDRLTPVLRVVSEKNGQGVGVPEQALAPIANYLREKRDKLCTVSMWLNDVLNRLEI